MLSKSAFVRRRKRTPFMVNPDMSLQFTDSLPIVYQFNSLVKLMLLLILSNQILKVSYKL